MIYTADFLIERRRTLWEEKKSIEEDARYKEAAAKKILEDESLRKEIIFHPEKLIELEFVIVNKKKQVVPFFLNEVQRDFIARLNDAILEFEEGKRNEIRILILKGRQQGFTS